MKASFGKSIATGLKKTPNVWMVDATYPDISGKAVMSAAETAEVTKKLSDAGKVFRKVEAPVLKELEDNKELKLLCFSIKPNSKNKVKPTKPPTGIKEYKPELLWDILTFNIITTNKKSTAIAPT